LKAELCDEKTCVCLLLQVKMIFFVISKLLKYKGCSIEVVELAGWQHHPHLNQHYNAYLA